MVGGVYKFKPLYRTHHSVVSGRWVGKITKKIGRGYALPFSLELYFALILHFHRFCGVYPNRHKLICGGGAFLIVFLDNAVVPYKTVRMVLVTLVIIDFTRVIVKGVYIVLCGVVFAFLSSAIEIYTFDSNLAIVLAKGY
jgi:hypothetical protein